MSTVSLASYLAAALWLLPVGVVLYARAERQRPLWAMALDVPIAVTADLLLTLTLTLFVPLETATWLSRGLWLVFLSTRFFKDKRPARPRALGLRGALTGALGAGLGVYISMAISRPYSIWDRKWHTPLTSSMRGQMLPFHNVWNPAEVLHYHFSGNVFAAMTQSLSGGVIHSSLALSLSHDIMFGLAALSVALLCWGIGKRGAVVVLPLVIAVLLNGPLTRFRTPDDAAVEGYSVLNFITMSFRPHDAVAAVFYVGFLGAVVSRLRFPSAKASETIYPLLACTAGLALSDEATIAILGFSLGVTWLFIPGVVHPKRAVGVLLFGLLLVALVAPNLAFSAALSPGGPAQKLEVVPFRSPGCYMPVLPLSDPEGVRMLLYDIGPTALVVLGSLLASFATEKRRGMGLAVLGLLAYALSALFLTTLEINDEPLEAHRFLTGIMFVAPLLAGYVLFVLPRKKGALPLLVACLAFVISATGASMSVISTWSWMSELAPRKAHHHDHFFTREDMYEINCREDFQARLFERAEATYVPKLLLYPYAGCHPIFGPAKNNNQWSLTIGDPVFDKAGWRALDAHFVAKDEELSVICEPGPRQKRDAQCAALGDLQACEPLSRVVRCKVDAQERARVGR